MGRWSFASSTSATTIERSIQVLIGHEALTDIGAELDELHEEMRVPIMGRREWLEPWIQSYQDFRPLTVLVRAPSGRVDAAALLAERHRMGVREIFGMGHGGIDHSRLTARNEQAAALLGAGVARQVRGGLRPWRFCVAQLPVLDPATARFVAHLPRARVVDGQGMPTIRFTEDRTPSSYLSRGHRKETRNLLNKASREGLDPSFVRARDARGVAELLPEIDAVRRERDALLGRTTKLDDPHYANFRRSVLLRLADVEMAELVALRLGGEIAAYVVGLLDHDAYRMWDTRFSPRWARFSPGQLVIDAAIGDALGNARFEQFDMMRGLEDYKVRIATEIVPTQMVDCWSSPGMRVLFEAARVARDGGSSLMRRGLRHRRSA